MDSFIWTLIILHLKLVWPSCPNDFDLAIVVRKLIFDPQIHIIPEFYPVLLSNIAKFEVIRKSGKFPSPREKLD